MVPVVRTSFLRDQENLLGHPSYLLTFKLILQQNSTSNNNRFTGTRTRVYLLQYVF